MSAVAEEEQFHLGPLSPRLMSLVVSILVSLASGTSYVYSVFVPQLVRNSNLPVTVTAELALFVSLGGACGGFPGGLIVDNFGPRFSVISGGICTFVAFRLLNYVYETKSQNVGLLMFAMSCLGFGSITSFYAGVKVATANFPYHRGSAGACPVAAYALASLVYSAIALNFYDGDTAGFLRFIYLFAPSVCIVGSIWCVIYKKPKQPVAAETPNDTDAESGIVFEPPQTTPKQSTSATSLMNSFQQRRRSLGGSFSFWGVGNRTPRSSYSVEDSRRPLLATDATETDNRVHRSDSSVFYSAVEDTPIFVSSKHPVWDHYIVKLILQRIFFKFYIMLALLTGLGQMYIYTVGFIVVAQVNSTPENHLTIAEAQAIQVSTLAIASFLGRLSSGPISDLLRKKFKLQRLWCIFIASLLFILGHGLVTLFDSVEKITISSMIIGFAFGFVFGTFPAIVADSFGTEVFSTMWGLITTGSIVAVGLLTKLFGAVLQKNSDENGVCLKGVACYREAYVWAEWLSLLVALMLLFTIYVNYKKGVH